MSESAALSERISELVALGREFFEAGRLEEAEHVFRSLRSVTANDFEVNKQLGILLATKGDFAGARAPLEDAAAAQVGDAVVFNVLSVCAFETADYAAALASADLAVQLRRFYPEAHNSRGNALLRLGRPAQALQAFKAALALSPQDATLHTNLANAYEALDRPAEALKSVERALALAPRLATAHVNRGNILQGLGRHAQAIGAYDRAIGLDAGSVDAHWNRALCHLLTGDYAAGWAGYEWRWRRGARETRPRGFPQPLWLGDQDLAGRTILLHAEQGLGDCIQFVRYVPQVAARGGRVVLEAPAALTPLLRDLPGVEALVARGDPLPAFDLHCPLMSLPLALGQPHPAPEPRPYLSADPTRAAAWAERLGAATSPRVGLVCSGSPTHGKDAQRSIPFATLAAALPAGPEYHLLQKDLREGDRAALAARPEIRVWAETLGDFADTAALAAHMDLIVSVDTSVAHLAGAIGAPVWVLLPADPDWRWGLGRETTPWYPEMRLYRQVTRGDWNRPLKQIAKDLCVKGPPEKA
jgi:tetratricopeptide (TPR) repeat protein